MSGVMREPFPDHPPPITSRPEGLLSLLGLQTNGKYPQHLGYNTLGVDLDLLRWYLESQATFKTGTLTTVAGAMGTDSNLIVPAGEHWYVLQFVCWSSNLLAADGGAFLARSNGSGASIVALGPMCTGRINERHLLTQGDWALGYLARPSVQLGAVNMYGPNTVYNYTLRYARLQT